MGKINDGTFKDWNNGETMNEADYEKEREILRTAVNDNFDRLIKKYEVLNADGTVRTTQNLNTAINYLKFKDGSQISFTLDNTTSTLSIGVVDGSITNSKLADISVTTLKLADKSVTTAKLADSSVTLGKIDTTSLNTNYYTEAEIDEKLGSASGGESTSIRDEISFPTATDSHVLWRSDTKKFYIADGTNWVEFAKQTDVSNHTSNVSNPHSVTASQVGAEKTVNRSTTAPTDTSVLWLDTNATPNVLKRYDGISWIKATPTTANEVGAIASSEKGSANGVATLGSDGKLTVSQRPDTQLESMVWSIIG